jgi:hypothetical protein
MKKQALAAINQIFICVFRWVARPAGLYNAFLGISPSARDSPQGVWRQSILQDFGCGRRQNPQSKHYSSKIVNTLAL